MNNQTAGFDRQYLPLLIVISGPSGVGKDTVIQRLKERAYRMHFVVTMNSRPPRPNEVNGVDYWFISQEEFQRMIDADELLEHALVYGDHKGIPKAQVREALDTGKDVVLRVDVQGAATIRKLEPNALLIFLTTASEEELVTRLKERKTETPEKLKVRIQTARQEYQRLNEFDYVVVNRHGKLDEAVDTILAIIEAEHHAANPRKVTL